MGERRMARRPGYEDYSIFPAKFPNLCSLCGKGLAVGLDVIGKRLANRQWDIVCVACGNDTSARSYATASTARSSAASARPASRADEAKWHRQMPAATPVTRSAWSTLVDYLRSCVVQESLVAPVPLRDRDRWAVLPVPSETVLCGNSLTLPLLPQLQGLFVDLEPLEGVFYGWPTVVVLDDRRRPFVAPLFVRQLNEPNLRDLIVPVDEQLPQVNMGLLGMKWFPPEALASAAATIAGQALGFGQAAAIVATASRILTALGVPLPTLDPTALIDFLSLDDPWRPQEVGVFNMVMAFKGTVDAATRNLIKDLDWMTKATDWRDSAARFLFEDAPVPPVSLPMSSAMTLNDSQETALAWAATAPLTVITGPPGTGKSQTVTAILADAWRRGETALLSSTNNTPVDDVIDNKATAVDEALVLRTGNAEKRQQLGGRLRELVARASARSVDPVASSLTQAMYARHELSNKLGQRAEVDREALRTAIHRDETRTWLWGTDQQRPPDSMRASIRRRAVKADRVRWRWLRRRRTNRLLALAGITNAAATARQVLDWADSETAFEQAERNLSHFLRANPGDLVDLFDQANKSWQLASVATVRNQVRGGFAAGRESLIALADALADDLPWREATERAMAYVKGWATSALSTRPNFACRAGAVDLVVIDEASQCNLAQVLPLAYRAKRLVVVGDPDQLSPVVTANAEELRTLAIAAGTSHEALVTAHLTYGEDSAYTAFAARFHPGPLLLDEHYRCHPEIIKYCNQQFYDNKLTILTSVDRDGDPPRGLEWHDVDGRTEPGRSGSALNEAEAQAVVDWVLGSGLSAERLGVVTPFRAQAAKIRELLRQHGQGQVDGIRVGTAHTFQGGERDTIVFSTVISTGAMSGTVGWLEGERNLINVAVSRARQHLVVFGNRAELARARARTLLSLAQAASDVGRHPVAATTLATSRLHAALVARGLPASLGEVDEGYPLAITLSAINGDRIDIEVDEYPEGDPGGRTQRQRATRDANIRRLGWQVVRVPGWQAYLDPDAIAEHMWQVVTR